MDLAKLSIAELRKLRDQLTLELGRREQQQLASARQQVLAIAQQAGIPLSELVASLNRPNDRRKVAVRYRHPADASLQWTGRGRQPAWFRDWLASGKPIDQLLV